MRKSVIENNKENEKVKGRRGRRIKREKKKHIRNNMFSDKLGN